MNTIIVFAALVATTLATELHPRCACPDQPPICASNYKTYNGECWMNCDQEYNYLCKIHDGPCKPKPICGCPPAQAICASNYRTYNGECAMNCDADYTDLYKLYDGICAS